MANPKLKKRHIRPKPLNQQLISNTNSHHHFKSKWISVYNSNVLKLYKKWSAPTIIISDGPYGLNSYNGDLLSVDGLDVFYEPHVKAWTKAAKPSTTLWFWNSEQGWATVHPLLLGHGWKFVNCHIWNKGLSHIAGNANTKTLRKFPVVTEVCVQYVREPKIDNETMQEWLRSEWKRSGIPFSHANLACGVKNAATRKYLTNDHMWYFPPPDMFVNLVKYANKYGKKEGRPYFAAPNGKPFTKNEWRGMRAKFHCTVGITNVWNEPPVNGIERIRDDSNTTVHPNQKPLKIMQRIIEATSDIGDVVWEPFGGLCSAAVASMRTNRRCKSAEIDRSFYQRSVERLLSEQTKH